jgi:hypothetical protein
MREIIFEIGYLKFTTPLDPSEGKRYIEPTRGNNIEKLYNMIAQMEDYFKPTVDGALSWRSISLFTSYSEASLDHLQQRMQEVSTRQFACIN